MSLPDQYRCPSINPMDVNDRCRLIDDDEHEDGHEGTFGGRVVVWDYSPISVPNDTPERWEKVEP